MFKPICNLAASAAANSRVTGDIQERSLNGLIVHVSEYGALSKVSVSIALSDAESGEQFLAATIPLLCFASWSDLTGGSSHELTRLLGDLDAVAAGEAVSTLLRKDIAVKVELGMLHLRGTDKLTVTLEVGGTALSATETVEAFAYFDSQNVQETTLFYRLSADKNLPLTEVMGAALYRRDISGGAASEAAQATSAKLSVILREVGGQTDVFSGQQAYRAGLGIAEVESHPPRDMVLLFLDAKGSRGAPSFQVETSGSDNAKWDVFYIYAGSTISRVAARGAVVSTELASKTAAQAKMAPFKQKALEYQGLRLSPKTAKGLSLKMAQGAVKVGRSLSMR